MPILWDFGKQSMSFARNGHAIKWSVSSSLSTVDPFVSFATADVLEKLLQHFASLFTEPIGLLPEHQRNHQIQLLPGTPLVVVRSYHYMHHQKQELERQCAAMLTQGVIRTRSSAFAAPVLLVEKTDDSWRFCVDYQALNVKTVRDKFPIPVVEELLDELQGATFFSKLDLCSGYHQLLMHCDDVEKTTLRTHEGLFEFLVMSFGLTNAPATFQALMNDVLRPFLHQFILVFFVDILIFSSSWLEHLCHLHFVFTKLQEHSLFVKQYKCAFGERTVAYLGHVISADGVAMDAAKLQVVLDWLCPQSVCAAS
jgi:hypothetical protein